MDRKETKEQRRRRILCNAFDDGFQARDPDHTGLTLWERWFVYGPEFERGCRRGRGE